MCVGGGGVLYMCVHAYLQLHTTLRQVDRVNAPGKPLPSGAISLDRALLFASLLYISLLVGVWGACGARWEGGWQPATRRATTPRAPTAHCPPPHARRWGPA